MKTKRLFVCMSLCLAAFGIASCTAKPVQADETYQKISPTALIVLEKQTLTPTSQPARTSTPETNPSALPPDPNPVTFTASDGTELHGYYYPAAMNPAPLVVVMHWAGDDMSAWYEVAVWLQNRGLSNPFPIPGDPKQFRWWDSSWFPEVPADRSYGVFIFTFRGCSSFETGCLSFDNIGWLDDAQSAMVTARGLEGVDTNKIVAIGSSIGGDGAADGCLFLNQQYPASCQGAFSLSPDSYLTMRYDKVVAELGQNNPPITVWCVAAPFQFAPCKRAEAMGNNAYTSYEIPNGQHGTGLLRPGLDPLPMQLILDFLDETID